MGDMKVEGETGGRRRMLAAVAMMVRETTDEDKRGKGSDIRKGRECGITEYLESEGGVGERIEVLGGEFETQKWGGKGGESHCLLN